MANVYFTQNEKYCEKPHENKISDKYKFMFLIKKHKFIFVNEIEQALNIENIKK